MSRRVFVIPGTTWAMDRRTTRRHFLFNPDAEGRIEQAFWYCLGYTANKYKMLVHAAVLMSTHPHCDVTDTEGNRPWFKAEFHRLFALCIKAIRGWPEEVFNKGPTGENEPVTPKAMIRSLAHVVGNPSSSLAVRYASDWPGAKTLAKDIGTRVIRAKRPDFFFDPNNPQWPDEIELRLTMPEMLEAEYGAEEARRRIAEEVKKIEREAFQRCKREGKAFRGARRVLRTAHTVRANSYEEFGAVNPRLSAAGDLEAAQRKIAWQRNFDADYDQALAAWQQGDRNAVFPYGTWWMVVHHKARSRPPP